MGTFSIAEKNAQEPNAVQFVTSSDDGAHSEQTFWTYLKHYFTSREGWIGDYVALRLQTQNHLSS